MAEEFQTAADLYSGALDNVLRHYQEAEARAVNSKGCQQHAEAALALREKELAEYQRQADSYDELLRKASQHNEALSAAQLAQADTIAAQAAAYERDLDAYRKQASTYDDLLRESNNRASDLARQIVEHTKAASASSAAQEEALNTYRQRLGKCEQSLREAQYVVEMLTQRLGQEGGAT